MLKTVTIECDVPDGYEAVAHRLPKKGEFYRGPNGAGGVQGPATFDFDTTPYLIVRPIPPRMVPLGPEDVVPGKTLIRNSPMKSVDGTAVITYATKLNVWWTAGAQGVLEMTYERLQRDFEFSNDHGKTWAKCEKAAT